MNPYLKAVTVAQPKLVHGGGVTCKRTCTVDSVSLALAAQHAAEAAQHATEAIYNSMSGEMEEVKKAAEAATLAAEAARAAAEAAAASTRQIIDINTLSSAPEPGAPYSYDGASDKFVIDCQNRPAYVRILAVEGGRSVVLLQFANVLDGDLLELFIAKPEGVQVSIVTGSSSPTTILPVTLPADSYLIQMAAVQGLLLGISAFIGSRI